MDLRVCTYNVRWGIGMDGRRVLQRTADVIGRIDPDVIAIQELDRTRRPETGYEDQLATLQRFLGRDATYATTIEEPPTDESDGQPRRYGHAVLTSGVIERGKTYPLPGPSDAEPRALLETRIELDGRTLPVFAVHLGLEPDERVEQTKAILDRIDELAEVSPLKSPPEHVLLGDLNATPDSEPYRLLVDDGPYEDAIETAGVAEPTYPSPYVERDPEDEYVDDHVRTYVPRKRVDHVLVTPGIEVVGAEIRRSLASDHSPVVADLRL